MLESDFSAKLRSALRRFPCLVDKIETGETGRGIPDLHVYSQAKGTYWLELKVCANKNKVVVKLSPAQVVWHTNYAAKGGRSWIIVYMSEQKQTLLYHGRHAAALLTDAESVPVACTFTSIQACADYLEN